MIHCYSPDDPNIIYHVLDVVFNHNEGEYASVVIEFVTPKSLPHHIVLTYEKTVLFKGFRYLDAVYSKQGCVKLSFIAGDPSSIGPLEPHPYFDHVQAENKLWTCHPATHLYYSYSVFDPYEPTAKIDTWILENSIKDRDISIGSSSFSVRVKWERLHQCQGVIDLIPYVKNAFHDQTLSSDILTYTPHKFIDSFPEFGTRLSGSSHDNKNEGYHVLNKKLVKKMTDASITLDIDRHSHHLPLYRITGQFLIEWSTQNQLTETIEAFFQKHDDGYVLVEHKQDPMSPCYDFTVLSAFIDEQEDSLYETDILQSLFQEAYQLSCQKHHFHAHRHYFVCDVPFHLGYNLFVSQGVIYQNNQKGRISKIQMHLHAHAYTIRLWILKELPPLSIDSLWSTYTLRALSSSAVTNPIPNIRVVNTHKEQHQALTQSSFKSVTCIEQKLNDLAPNVVIDLPSLRSKDSCHWYHLVLKDEAER